MLGAVFSTQTCSSDDYSASRMNALCVLFVMGLATVALADDKNGYAKDAPKGKGYAAPSKGYSAGLTYQGKYAGKCGNDGFYHNGYDSFVICSNGNGYVQRCAPGTRNSNEAGYRANTNYDYFNFCDVNLVDSGYAARHSRGYGHRPVGYPYGYVAYQGYPYGYPH